MKPTDEWKFTCKSLPQKLYEPDRERAEILVGARRAHDRRGAKAVTSAETIVASFNTWAFKREQPDSKALLVEQVSKAIARGQPVRFVLYWGKGPRNVAGPKEAACLDFLAQMQSRIQALYAPGARMTIVFTDTHAQLNGHKAPDIASYFKSVTEMLPPTGFDTCHLASIVRDAKPILGDFDPEKESLDGELLATLIGSAQKWYRGGASAEEGAAAYYRANLLERRAMEICFPESIFVTFNGGELRGLFPEKLPIFYMYSLRKGFAVKPWFLA